MGRMMRELAADPSIGLLSSEGYFGRTTMMVQYWRSESVPATHALLSGHGSLLAVAGLLLGYYLVYAWCVKWRVARLERLRGYGTR